VFFIKKKWEIYNGLCFAALLKVENSFCWRQNTRNLWRQYYNVILSNPQNAVSLLFREWIRKFTFTSFFLLFWGLFEENPFNPKKGGWILVFLSCFCRFERAFSFWRAFCTDPIMEALCGRLWKVQMQPKISYKTCYFMPLISAAHLCAGKIK